MRGSENSMRSRILMAIAMAAIVASTSAVTSDKAEARCYGCWAGAGIAAALIGGAILSNRAYGYGYGPSYYGGYGYSPYRYGYAPAYYARRYYPPRYYNGYRPRYYGYRPRYYAPRYYAPR